MVESLNEACGVFGIYNNPLAAQLTYLGLYALQHRGQESSGIAVADGTSVSVHKGMGLVIRFSNTKNTGLSQRSVSHRT